jgi:phosphonate transport system substrate-binding protein
MNHSLAWCRVASFVLSLLLLSAGARAANGSGDAPGCEAPAEIRFSLSPIRSDMDKEIAKHQPLFERIEKLTGRRVKTIRPSTYNKVIEGLLGGQIDIATVGPASYVLARQGDARIEPFATLAMKPGAFSDGGPTYHSLLISLAAGSLKSIEALRGRSLSLTDPASTSGSVLPRQRFAPGLGMPLEQYFGRVAFAGNHSKSLELVLTGEMDAAFVSSTLIEQALADGRLTPGRLQVLWKSEPIAYDPFVYRGQLCASLRRGIRAAFLDAQATGELAGLLRHFKAERFVPVGDEDYANIRELVAQPPR